MTNFAFNAPIKAGIKETTIIPMIISEKCCLTTGKLPKKYPDPQQSVTQATTPARQYGRKVLYFPPEPPKTNGDIVRMIGMKRASEMAIPPCFSKNASVFFK